MIFLKFVYISVTNMSQQVHNCAFKNLIMEVMYCVFFIKYSGTDIMCENFYLL